MIYYRIRYRHADTVEIGYTDWTSDMGEAMRAQQLYQDCGYVAEIETRVTR